MSNLNQQQQAPVLAYCAQQRKGASIEKAMASGHLNPDLDDPVQASLDCVFTQAGVTCVILSSANPEHFRAHFNAALHACNRQG